MSALRLPWESVLISSLICFIALSCGKDSLGPGDDPPEIFSFTLTVTDEHRSPVSGLLVSAWGQISGLSPRKVNAVPLSPANVNAVSVVGFEVPVVSHISLIACDLDGQPIGTIADLPSAMPGRHVAAFSVSRSAGMRVFKCRLVATETASGATLFRDSIYALLWQFDPAMSIVGFTSSSGVFQTRDSLIFPNVLSLPPITRTDATGPASLGTMHLSDTVIVVLSDTVARKSQSYACVVTRGRNDVQVTWAPGSTPPPPVEGGRTTFPVTPVSPTSSSRPDFVWKLDQNYPNPFN